MNRELRDTPRVIKTPFPARRFRAYVRSAGAVSPDDLDGRQIEHIFQAALRDFRTGRLSLDARSSIAGRLWTQAFVPSDIRCSPDLHAVLLAGSELSFYVRKSGSDAVGRIFLSFLRQVLGFTGRRTG